jgi:hypothetical protein
MCDDDSGADPELGSADRLARDGHDVQGSVDAAIAGAGKPMALLLTRGCVEWCGAVPGGEPVTGGESVDVADVGEQ